MILSVRQVHLHTQTPHIRSKAALENFVIIRQAQISYHKLYIYAMEDIKD